MTIRIDEIADLSDVTTGESFAPLTPGQILKTEFLDPLRITQYRLAKEINVPATRIGSTINDGRGITADTDLRLCKFFKLSDGYFLRLQEQYDLEVARTALVNVLPRIHTYVEVLSVQPRLI